MPRLGRPVSAFVVAGVVVLGAACSQDRQSAGAAPEPPPGLEYVPPEPGSYALPPIQRAVDGTVLDADGSEHRLFEYLDDKLVLLAFVYLNCEDARACPLAMANFHLLQQDLAADPELAARVRMVTLSFDPDRDTPAALLAHRGREYLDVPWGRRDWSLLTTRSWTELQPMLDGFGQFVAPEIDESGQRTGGFSHVLKVFLIDTEKRVRNIYSTSYLHPAIALADLRTLVLEEAEIKEAAR